MKKENFGGSTLLEIKKGPLNYHHGEVGYQIRTSVR